MTHPESLALAIEGIKACLMPYPSLADKCADIVAILQGEKVAIPIPDKGNEPQGFIPRKALADYLGVRIHALTYHTTQGHLDPVRVEGSKRVLGFTCESVRRFLGIDNLDTITRRSVTNKTDTEVVQAEKPIKRKELAALLGVNARTIDRYRDKGKLKALYHPESGQVMGYIRASVRECFGNIV